MSEEKKDIKKKKRGPIRKTAHIVFLPLTAPFTIGAWILRDLVGLVQWFADNIRTMPRRLKDERAAFRLAIAEEREKPSVDHRAVLEAWGVEDAESAHQKIRELNFHLVIWSATLTLGFACVYEARGTFFLASAVAMVIVATGAILGVMWRKHIVRAPRYVYFTDWLRGRN